MEDLSAHAAMGAALVEFGHMTSEAVAADRAAIEGNAAPAGEAAVAASPVGPLVAAAFEGGASPASYQFEHMPGVQSDPAQELALRTFFHAEGVPVPIAKQMNAIFTKGALNPPNDVQLAASKHTTMAALSKQWGADTEKNLATANREIDRMEQSLPGLKAQLLATGVGNNVWLISTIYNMAQAKGRTA